MNGKVKFLFFCMIFVGASVFAQKPLKINAQYKNLLFFNPSIKANGIKFHQIVEIKNTARLYVDLKPGVYSIIKPGFYSDNLGFFCKKELQLEKITKIPFKFRLGSVQVCDWLEGKLYSGLH